MIDAAGVGTDEFDKSIISPTSGNGVGASIFFSRKGSVTDVIKSDINSLKIEYGKYFVGDHTSYLETMDVFKYVKELYTLRVAKDSSIAYSVVRRTPTVFETVTTGKDADTVTLVSALSDGILALVGGKYYKYLGDSTAAAGDTVTFLDTVTTPTTELESIFDAGDVLQVNYWVEYSLVWSPSTMDFVACIGGGTEATTETSTFKFEAGSIVRIDGVYYTYNGASSIDAGSIIFKDTVTTTTTEVESVFVGSVLDDVNWSITNFRYEDIEDYMLASDEAYIIASKNPGVWGKSLAFSTEYSPSSYDENISNIYVTTKHDGAVLDISEVSLIPAKNGFQLQIIGNEVFKNDENFSMKVSTSILANTEVSDVASTTLGGGDDGVEPDAEALTKALSKYSDADGIRFIGIADMSLQTIVPGYSGMLDSLNAVTRKDAVAVHSIPAAHESDTDAVSAYKQSTSVASSYSIFCSPSVYTQDIDNGITKVLTGNSGHILGNLCRVAGSEALGPWISSAGWENGQLKVVDLFKSWNKDERKVLANDQVNPIRKKVGKGIALYDQFTSQKHATATQYLNVRMLLTYAKVKIEDIVEHYQFRMNDEDTRSLLKDLADFEFTKILNRNGLYKFETVCDETNNTSVEISKGELVLDYYLDPKIPYRLGRIRAVLVKTGADFSSVKFV